MRVDEMWIAFCVGTPHGASAVASLGKDCSAAPDPLSTPPVCLVL